MATVASPDISQVVVPVDGSRFAENAIEPGRALAERLHVSMTVITVVPPGRLEASAGPVPGALVLVGDDAGDTIGEYADDVEGSVVCMATHGRGWPASAFIGSAASMALARSERPMVLVGPGCQPGWTLEGAVLVAAVDGQAGSELMLPVAARWASMLGIGLTIVTVAEPVPPPLRPQGAHPLHGLHGDPQAYLDKLVVSLADFEGPISGQVIWDPVGPAVGLRSFIGEPAGGDGSAHALLAVSSHGRSRRPGIPLGRSALHIVHESPVPCLIVPLLADGS